MIKRVFVSCLMLVMASSCGNKHDVVADEKGDIERVNLGGDEGAVVFSDVSFEIFEKSCTSCHAGYADYENVINDLEMIVEEVLAGTMPKFSGPLNNELKQLLIDWVEAGSLEK